MTGGVFIARQEGRIGVGTVTRGGAMLSGASRRVGVTVRLVKADIEPPATLTTREIDGPTFIETRELQRRHAASPD